MYEAQTYNIFIYYMDFKQRSTIVNTYFKYTGIYFVLAILIPVFVNLNGDETSFISWMKFLFVLVIGLLVGLKVSENFGTDWCVKIFTLSWVIMTLILKKIKMVFRDCLKVFLTIIL